MWIGTNLKCGLSKRCSSTTVRDRLSYAKKFSHYLMEKDFNEIQMLSDDKRIHVMKALSTLSKLLSRAEGEVLASHPLGRTGTLTVEMEKASNKAAAH